MALHSHNSHTGTVASLNLIPSQLSAPAFLHLPPRQKIYNDTFSTRKGIHKAQPESLSYGRIVKIKINQ